jgi:putative alpha-1,2-mannosidase
MLTRRQLLGGTVLAGLGSHLKLAQATASNPRLATDFCSYVDPFIGTGGHGHTFPGATVPFGMVQLSPDTDVARWDACSGYHHDDTSILGFSHTHLSGTGVGDMLDVLVVPATGPVRLEPGSLQHPQGSYRTRFEHADERASPGYYRVLLKEHGIEAELTATARAGLHRYRFAQPEAGHLLIDLCHGAQETADVPTKVTEGDLRMDANNMLVGTRHVHQWADGRVIYFALQVSRPFAAVDLYSNDRILPPGSVQARGAGLKCVLHFPDAAAAPLLVKVGISSVDIDGNSGVGFRRSSRGCARSLGTRAGTNFDPGRHRYGAADILHGVVSRDARSDLVFGCRRPLSGDGHDGSPVTRRSQQLQHLFPLGYLPGPPSFIHAHST